MEPSPVRLPITDVLAALGQIAATTSNDIHRSALREALAAVQFRHAVEAALERHAPDQAPALTPATPGAAWSPQEDLQLRIAFESGMSLDAIAERHGREPLEVAVRLHKPLDLLTEQAVEEIRMARHRQRPRDAEQPVTVPAPTAVAAPAPAPAPMPAPAPAPAPAPVAAPAPAPVAAPEAAAVPAVAPAPPAAPVAQAETPAAPGAKPTLTAEEEKAVNSVLTKYTAKNAPKATLRSYIESEKFTAKVRPEVLAWLRAELDRLA